MQLFKPMNAQGGIFFKKATEDFIRAPHCLVVKPPNHPQIQKNDDITRQYKYIAGMRICVKKAVFKNLFKNGCCGSAHDKRMVICLPKFRFYSVSNLYPLNKLSDQDSFCG